MLYRIAIEPLWGEARWQIMSECLLAFPVTVAFHLSCCTSPGRPNQSNIRALPCSSTTPFTWFLAVSNVHVLTAKKSWTPDTRDDPTSCLVASLPSTNFHIRGKLLPHWAQCFLVSACRRLSQHFLSPSQWRLNMNTHMNIWISKQVVIVIHLHALCRTCKVFCLQPVLLLSMGFLTECLK